MTKLMTALLAMALFLPVAAIAQDASQTGQTDQHAAQQEANQAAMNQVDGMSTQPVHKMGGMVSNDGKTFTSNNTSYIVANPHMLKKYDNQNVNVEFQFNPTTNKIHIMKVNPGQ
jgi:hypothetical protein